MWGVWGGSPLPPAGGRPARLSYSLKRAGGPPAVPGSKKSRFLLQPRKPRPRRLFGRRADLRRLLSGELVEIGIAIAAGFGDQVPFDRFSRIERRAMADAQQSGQAVPGNRATAQGGLADKRRRLRLSLG